MPERRPSIVQKIGQRLQSLALKALANQQFTLPALCRLGCKWREMRQPTPVSNPRNVLHVTCSFDLGGTQRQIINLCERRGDAPFVHDAIEIFPEHNYLYRQQEQLDPARYESAAAFGRVMRHLTMDIGTRSAQPIQIYKLARDFKALKPDVVVGWGHEMCMLTFVAAALARVPHIVFCIRTFNPTFGWTTPTMGSVLRRAHKRMQPRLSGTIANSTAVRADYSEWIGIPLQSVRVCANGIQLQTTAVDVAAVRERIRRQHGVPSDAVVICNIGRFSKEKGQRLMIEANERLLARYGPAAPWWLLCGDGPLLDDMKRLAVARGMSHVRFAGRIDDAAGYLNAADIFVMPSDFEGMPNAMMEAMAHGLPSVSTNRSGALDVARDGVEALYCAPGEADELAAHLVTLIENPSERTRLGANARKRIEEFSIERGARAFNHCLETLVRQPMPPDSARDAARHEVVSPIAKHGRGGSA